MGRSIDRLTPLDRLMLEASERWPRDIGALAILDGTIPLDPAGELRIDDVCEAIASRLHLVGRHGRDDDDRGLPGHRPGRAGAGAREQLDTLGVSTHPMPALKEASA